MNQYPFFHHFPSVKKKTKLTHNLRAWAWLKHIVRDKFGVWWCELKIKKKVDEKKERKKVKEKVEKNLLGKFEKNECVCY